MSITDRCLRPGVVTVANIRAFGDSAEYQLNITAADGVHHTYVPLTVQLLPANKVNRPSDAGRASLTCGDTMGTRPVTHEMPRPCREASPMTTHFLRLVGVGEGIFDEKKSAVQITLLSL